MTTTTVAADVADKAAQARQGALVLLWDSTIGKKLVMAASGLVLVGFVIAHMVGNLKIFSGEDKFNGYAAGLRSFGAPFFGHEQALWIARLVLLAAVLLHMLAAWQLTRRSWAARPSRYAEKVPLKTTYAARTMRWGGVIIVLFVVYHLLHFTFGTVGYAPGQFKPLSVYRNVVLGFSVWYVSAFYIVAQLALGLHLYHGVWSMFQTLGVTSAAADSGWRRVAVVIALAVTLGNISMPIAVLTGVLR